VFWLLFWQLSWFSNMNKIVLMSLIFLTACGDGKLTVSGETGIGMAVGFGTVALGMYILMKLGWF
jgi:hypothetical protein